MPIWQSYQNTLAPLNLITYVLDHSYTPIYCPNFKYTYLICTCFSFSNPRLPLSGDQFQTQRLKNRNWSQNLSILLRVGFEKIRVDTSLCNFLTLTVRLRWTYFMRHDLSRSHCPFRCDKISSDKIVKIKLPIGSRTDPNIMP